MAPNPPRPTDLNGPGPSPEAPVENLENIGPVTAGWLRSIGIGTRGELQRVGPLAAYHMLTEEGYNTSLVLVYALEGALRGVHWNRLPPEHKARLRARARAAPEG